MELFHWGILDIETLQGCRVDWANISAAVPVNNNNKIIIMSKNWLETLDSPESSHCYIVSWLHFAECIEL